MLSDNDVQETEINEKYIFQQKTKKNFYACTGTCLWHSLQVCEVKSRITGIPSSFKVRKLFYFCISDKYSSFDEM